MQTHTLKLKDGRNLIYAEYGQPNDLPLIFLHGTPGSHILPNGFIAGNTQAGFRMIVPSRPGYSYSDPKSGYTLLDYVDDITELADSLSLPQFGILGGSGGGRYTFACAAKIAHRLSVVGVFSSPAPLSEEVLKTMPTSAEVEAAQRPFIERALNNTQTVIDEMIATAADQDRAGLEQNRAYLAVTLHEAYRQGLAGSLGDFEASARHWGFALEAIKIRVHLWHGEKDAWVSIADAQTIAASIPDCVVQYLPDTGHYIPDEDFLNILMTLKKEMEAK